MDKLVFSSSNEALMYLANTLNRKVIIAEKSEVKNPRSKPKNDSEKKNWNRSDMWGKQQLIQKSAVIHFY